MANLLFDRPLFVQREHFVEEVVSLEDAIDLLESWPAAQRGLAHETLMNACREACNGRFPLEAIRSNLTRFLRKAGILLQIEDVPNFGQISTSRTIGSR
jgi:hypothetical protein